MIPIYILIIIGIAVGALTGITGSSGVLIVVPALSYLGLSYYDSIGSSLLVDVITTISVIFVYFKNKNVDLKISLILGLGAIIGAQLGSRIALVTPERYLEAVFTIFTAYMAYVSFRRSRNPKLNIKRLNLNKISFIIAVILSMLIGVVTGVLGASGGIMFIAVMMLLFSIDVKRMIGTATLAMLLSATSGASAYLIAGRTDIIASVVIGATALISGYYFAKLANKMNPAYIYMFLGSVFVITSISEFFKAV
ncbi:TSUP family transporter [Acidianus sulfidivorans JP7]|uniref:Probable membrane transporter protein n=1 Tax=Acidianus sulfidivorans JP7 TaxID=619593 RepID=A0A2U9IPM8_9CREN|nr:sulfite exporter TauE/SafE family protein [Acidianus sulfidivorans]AWR97937.1 TSUP family transporter [Acidianus sulfidivorans JP7]